MQGDINFGSRRGRVMRSKIQKRIKCRSRVRVQKCFTQPRLAGFVNGEVLPFVSGITETCFPVPRLEIIAKFSHLTTQAYIEELVPVGELFMPGTGVINPAKDDSGSYRETASIGKKIWNSRVGDRERIKRILDWHTDTVGTKTYVGAWFLERIGGKRHRRQRRIEK